MPAHTIERQHYDRAHAPDSGHLDTPVSQVMTPGVVCIAEDATLRQVYRALHIHRVHAVLVVGRLDGSPLGWITTRGLLAWLEHDDALVPAREAITEDPVTVEPGASVREALAKLTRPETTRLLVARRDDVFPEGVLTDTDLLRVAAH